MAAAGDPHGTYDAVLVSNAGMRARDGTWLATDVWRPARGGEPLPGPFPAILTRTPYSRRAAPGRASHGTGMAWNSGEFWARHGYLGVVQDVRGRFDSGGEFVLIANEGPDGYDAVEWTAALPYCDGQVGTMGTSYMGWTQSAAAVERPPHLRAMWINQGGSDGRISAVRHNGAMELRWLCWAVCFGAVSREALADPSLADELAGHGRSMREWLRRLPWPPGGGPLARLPSYDRWARALYEGADDEALWASSGLAPARHYDRTADVPTVYSGGWYDSYARATTDAYRALAPRLSGQRLLMGPWNHGARTMDLESAGDVDFGPGSTIAGSGLLPPAEGRVEGQLHLHRRWFDHWLRGARNGVDREPPVRLFVMGGGDGDRTPEGRLRHGGSWRDERAWPPEAAAPTPFYLHPGGRLAEGRPQAGGGASDLRFDPLDPLPTISANTSSLHELLEPPARVTLDSPLVLMRSLVTMGGSDQSTRPGVFGARAPYGPLSERPDVLAFSSAPLERDVEVIGPVEAELYVSTDVPDTDIFAMLLDLYPPSPAWPRGYRLNVADGLLRLRYRDGFEPRPMEPGERCRVTVPLYPTANRFRAGHRIGLWVSSSSFPRFDVNPNTGEPLGRHTRTRIAHTRVHHDEEAPSLVRLPVVAA